MQFPLDLFDATEAPATTRPDPLQARGDADGDTARRGAVFTRPEVVEFILDLIGYTPDLPLPQRRILEPSFGAGDFLLPIIGRLLAAWSRSPSPRPVEALGPALRAVEIHPATFAATRLRVIERLAAAGLDAPACRALADRWLVQADFLLAPPEGPFDFVAGNPPYVRQELIPPDRLETYRRRYATLYDRADLYVAFLEAGLSRLAPHGCLGVICADRWMKNRYGGPLRALVSRDFHLKMHVDMMDTPAFQSDVIAYPAITVIAREPAGPTRIAHRPEIVPRILTALADTLRSPHQPSPDSAAHEIAPLPIGDAPWLLGTSDATDLIRRIEADFPDLESAGCRVGIGVATGADRAFIGDFTELDVEPDRKLPLATTKDLVEGQLRWRGLGVINPFTETGALVDLAHYPRLRRYLEHRRDVIAARHCARKSPTRWYRTIDRITPALARRPKLLIPDIKGAAHVVHEAGWLYPHHNLYHVTSDTWDLHALQAVLLSSLTHLFMSSYSTRMNGGSLRFQAQYLRRLRLPRWESVPDDLRQALAEAARCQDIAACDQAVAPLYRLSVAEQAVLSQPSRHPEPTIRGPLSACSRNASRRSRIL